MPYSSNGDGMIFLVQDDDFVIHTNATQQAVFNNTGVTFNKQLTRISLDIQTR